MGTLVKKQNRVLLSYTFYRDQTEAFWPGHILEVNMGLIPDTKQRMIRSPGHMYIVHPGTQNKDIPKHLQKLVLLYTFSRTGRYQSTNDLSGGRIKTGKKGYKVIKDKNRRAINYRINRQVAVNRLSWAWDIEIPTAWLTKAKIKKDPKSMIQEKRDKQPYKEADMPVRKSKKVKRATGSSVEDIKRSLDDLEDIGVGIETIISEGILTKDMIKRYLDDLFDPTDEE